MQKQKLENRKIKEDALISYGFTKKENSYWYETDILDHTFKMIVSMDNDKITSKLIEISCQEEYFMVDVKDTMGEYIGKIKEEYENIIQDILDKCSEKTIFKSKQAKEIIQYIQNVYGDSLEYLWTKFPKNAIWRNQKNHKWYGILLVIPSQKLEINSADEIEILDIRYPKDKIQKKIDSITIFPGYHMNKDSWITILLNDSIDTQEIYKFIDDSYQISLKK